MIGKIIGAGVGAALSKQTRSIGGTTGAVLGTVAVPIISRLSIPAMLVIAAGGYAVKKFADKGRTGAPRANV